MKLYRQILIAIILLEIAPALTLSEIQVAYQAQVLKIDEERKASIDTLQKGYQKALTKIQHSFQKTGDLERTLMVKNEGELISKGTWPLRDLPEEIAHRVGSPRKLYLKSYVGIERKWALSIVTTSDKMIELLGKKKVELTKAGLLEEAAKAQMLLETIDKYPDIIKARDLRARVSAGGRSKAAFVLRRGGDDLEVLVKYDSEGKISYKSPVENIVEKTGKRKEKGKTTAKNLGEFIGAKGFEVAPYLAFNESVDTGKLEFDEVIDVDFKKKVKVNDEFAMEMAIRKGARGSYFRLKKVFSPLAAPATYRLSAEYLIPADNKKVSGIAFFHGASGGKNLGATSAQKGKWDKIGLTASSEVDADFLTCYYQGVTGKGFKDAVGDKVYFKNLKIEHVKFSAFVVESYGPNGNLVKKEHSAEIQKMFIKNGSLISNS